jgi:uncharacterized protein
MDDGQTIILDGIQVELRVPDDLALSALRGLFGATSRDAEIDALELPVRPIWLWMIISLLRLYRRLRPPSIGNRCVFDPSCSRYSEMAYRQYGFIKGTVLTFRRLQRCKPSNGGVDIP